MAPRADRGLNAMTTISGKTIYITGGTRGIGLAAARALAARGAHVLLLSRAPDADALAEVASARASADQRVAHLCLDVADRDAVVSTIARAQAEFGAPDVVIHGAGIGSAREFSDMEFEEFDRVMRVNLYGSRHLVEAVLPAMLRKGRGKIVLVGSMGGYVPVYGYTAYGTSKFAVVGFAQCLRYELKPRGVEVACFCPGEVDTPGLADERLSRASRSAGAEEHRRNHQRGRRGARTDPRHRARSIPDRGRASRPHRALAVPADAAAAVERDYRRNRRPRAAIGSHRARSMADETARTKST